MFPHSREIAISCKMLLCFFRWSTVSVKVTLEDINDHVPVFDEQFYTVTVTEGAAVNSMILTVKVMQRT